MVAHAAMLMQHAQRWAADDPLVVAGDFNIKPQDPCYSLMADGSLSPSHPQHPSPAPWDSNWTPSLIPMRSAYQSYNGVEPEYTNYAHTAWYGKLNEEAFCATLDYIWLSPQWHVCSVLSLPPKSALANIASYPTAEEPSDHIMIAAKLELR